MTGSTVESALRSVYRLFRRMVPDPNLHAAIYQYRHRLQYEPDFAVFRHFDDKPGLVVDVGANCGQSALSVLRSTQRLKVVSFEPSMVHRNALRFIKLCYPRRFRYHCVGLSSQTETRALHTPQIDSGPISGRASVRQSEFSKDYVRADISKQMSGKDSQLEFSRESVNLRPLDQFNLSPLLIKIDVEGLEASVLAGAEQTIKSHRPILLMEKNNTQEYFPMLEAWGYKLYSYLPHADRLVPITDEIGPNFFAVHASNRQTLPYNN